VVDEAVIGLNDEQYWLYTAVDPETSKLLHTTLETTTNKAISHALFAELRENTTLTTPCFSFMVRIH
jgi:transposase-like protein